MMPRRLFAACAGQRFVMATTLADAEATLGEPARWPTVEDLRQLLASQTQQQLRDSLGISRQALHAWRLRAGVAPERRRSNRAERAQLLLAEGHSTEAVAEQLAAHPRTVRRWAKSAGIQLRSKKMADADLVALAKGKTWQQLAEASGKTLHALRRRVYASPDLARAMRAVMVRKAPGDRSPC